ncbi:PH domain-containing protein [Natrononativus amylolyticus]|uniref:PH domain-containing protein n=1 Tax=Natrononativus amylolyticus TaxID=2963434 RepID=UPI0020CCA076|nr:PH domain-containing protein [Natrononativus amylolyticus]
MSGNRLHPLSAVVNALGYAIQIGGILFFLVMILSGITGVVDSAWTTVVFPVGLVLGAAYGLAYYYRFEYELTGDTFDVASGVFSRRDREIPFRRIQNVDVRQGVFHRLFGLAVVSIETAGGGDTEAALRFVSQSEATRLQREIRRRTAEKAARDDRGAADANAEPTAETEAPSRDGLDDVFETDRGASGRPPATLESTTPTSGVSPGTDRPTLLFDLRSRELLLYAFTTFRPAAAAGLVFFAFLFTDPLLEYLLAVSQPVGGPADLETGTTGNYAVFTAISFLNAVGVTYLFSVIYSFGAYYGFRLGRAGEDFVYERGLLQRYSGSIPAEKVQSVTVTDNPLQRLIGYAGLWVETAGYGPESSGGSQSAVPLARSGRAYRFAERLMDVETPRFRSPPTLARRRYLGRYSILAGAVVALAFALSTVTALERWYLASVVFLAVAPAAHLRYVNLGYYVGDDHLVIRRGFWRRRTTVIPYYRLQTVSTRRSIFQRRLGLASVVVDTASSRTLFWTTPTIYDVDLETARAVHGDARGSLQETMAERRRGADGDGGGVSVAFT